MAGFSDGASQISPSQLLSSEEPEEILALFVYIFQRLRGSCGIRLPGLGYVLTAATG